MMKFLYSIAPDQAREQVMLGMALLALAASSLTLGAATLPVPNYSFESPEVPPESPYASPEVGDWKKTEAPAWYDPSTNNYTPWEWLSGQFTNVPFAGHITNCDGEQAAFIFALPEVGLFQDYDAYSGTSRLSAVYAPGKAYDLTVGLIGGLGGMYEGVTFEVGLYYRDTSSNKVIVAATSVTNTPTLFPTNNLFVDFQAHVPVVKPGDPWAGKHIGVQLLSTVRTELAGGYWDVDNVRLLEHTPVLFTEPGLTNGQFSFSVVGEPGGRFEIQAATNPAHGSAGWISLGTYTNSTGVTVVTDAVASSSRLYRARQF